MTVRFEVQVNGTRACVAGIDGAGIVEVTLNHTESTLKGRGSLALGISGVANFDLEENHWQDVVWQSHKIAVGDEIRIRVLPPGEFDAPDEIRNSP